MDWSSAKSISGVASEKGLYVSSTRLPSSYVMGGLSHTYVCIQISEVEIAFHLKSR